jgi:hypothetical protein
MSRPSQPTWRVQDESRAWGSDPRGLGLAFESTGRGAPRTRARGNRDQSARTSLATMSPGSANGLSRMGEVPRAIVESVGRLGLLGPVVVPEDSEVALGAPIESEVGSVEPP